MDGISKMHSPFMWYFTMYDYYTYTNLHQFSFSSASDLEVCNLRFAGGQMISYRVNNRRMIAFAVCVVDSECLVCVPSICYCVWKVVSSSNDQILCTVNILK